jgi:hypothetical protein
MLKVVGDRTYVVLSNSGDLKMKAGQDPLKLLCTRAKRTNRVEISTIITALQSSQSELAFHA